MRMYDGMRLTELCYCVHTCVRDTALWILFNIGLIFFFQAEDGIRDTDRSRGLGDVYKRQFDYP